MTYPCTGSLDGGLGDMILMAPPLVINAAEIDEILNILDDSLTHVETTLGKSDRIAMKLSLTIQTPEVPVLVPVALLSGTLEEKLAKAARMGANGVELITTEPASLDIGTLKALLDIATGYRLPPSPAEGMAFAAKLTLLNPDAQAAALARQRLDELIALASALHAPVITVGSFRGRSLGDPHRSLDKLAQILRRAGDRAAETGVGIALEPLNRFEGDLLNNVAQGLAFLNELDHTAVGLLVDTFHVNIEEFS